MEKENTIEVILTRLRTNVKCCPIETEIDKAKKGAYIDSIVIIEQMLKSQKTSKQRFKQKTFYDEIEDKAFDLCKQNMSMYRSLIEMSQWMLTKLTSN